MKQPLLPEVKKSEDMNDNALDQMPIITRYNIFIETYNKPNCIVDNIVLHKMPTSPLYDSVFTFLNTIIGKILFVLLQFVPVLDCIIFIICSYCCYVYNKCLNIHESNSQVIADPFKNMVFDPQLCFKLKKDYYAFTIEFKELQGFSLNYNKQIRKELSLREERGKANFLIYNANFWTSYHHFGRWKKKHIGVLTFSLFVSIIWTTIFFIVVL